MITRQFLFNNFSFFNASERTLHFVLFFIYLNKLKYTTKIYIYVKHDFKKEKNLEVL